MPRTLLDALASGQRGELSGGPEAKISAPPEPSWGRKLLEMVTGYPAEPDRDMAPSDAVGMLLSALPVGGKLLSKLPMDEASRLARSKLTGHTMDVFHATPSLEDFNMFESPVSQLGDFGIHVTPRPETAEAVLVQRWAPPVNGVGPNVPKTYHPGSRIMPLRARIEKSLEMPDVGLWKNPDSWVQKLSDHPTITQADKLRGLIPEQIVTSLKRMSPTNDPDTLKDLYNLAKANSGDIYASSQGHLPFQHGVRQILQGRGYDSIAYPNFTEGKGELSYLLLEPSQLRSKWAAFDPAKKYAGNLLAGLAGAAVVGNEAREAKKK